MLDQTAKMSVANLAGLMTHDLRAFMRAGINLVEDNNCAKLPWDRGISREDFSNMTKEQLLQVYDSGIEAKLFIEDCREHMKEVNHFRMFIATLHAIRS